MRKCKYEDQKVTYVNKLVHLLYDDLGESCGGMLHIVLDDGNVDDDDIEWCIAYVNRTENRGRPDYYISMEIATKMLELSIKQRRLIYYTDIGFSCGEDCDCQTCVIEHEKEC